RFPYLHNGSVASVRQLLTEPSDRMTAFSLKDAGEFERFDAENLGLTLPDEKGLKSLLKNGKKGKRDVYDTRRQGQSSEGHNFFTTIPADQKDAIIEYLKTL
ncbi:MAG: hypothetical protein KDD25_10395, partial [Bdellovibrionales bacterium]|nr:hypothetical protein [Bdellovibrionales bacterium]